MLRTFGPAAACLAPGLPACGQLLGRLAAAQASSGAGCLGTQQPAPIASVSASTSAPSAAPGAATSSSSSGSSPTPTTGAPANCANSNASCHNPGGANTGLSDSTSRGWRNGCGVRSTKGAKGGTGSGGGGWQWGRGSGWGSGSAGARWGAAAAAAAAGTGAAAGVFAASGLLVASADAPASSNLVDAAAAAQQALSSAWSQVEEDLARMNARLPSHASSLKGEPPSVSVVHDAVEVVVPIREGADPDAVLRVLRFGFGQKGSVSYNESVYGASRTVRLEMRPDSSQPETFLRVQLFVPPPGGTEQAQAVVSKRSAFTPDELAAISRVVQAANLTAAVDRPATGATARRHGLHGGLGPADLNQQLEQLFSEMERSAGPFGALFSGSLRQMFEELHRGLGPQEDGEDESGGFGGRFGGGTSDGGDGAQAGGFSGWQPPVPQPGAAIQRPRGPGAAGSAVDGHDWGSTEAKRAVEYLLSIGAQVFPPGNKSEMDWGVLAGYEDQKRTIEDCLLLPLLRPDVYAKLAKATRKTPTNIRPRAVLFEGPPGTGKTTSARVISSQAAVPLIYMPLEAVLSKWYGESEQQLGQVFKAAEAMGGAIIFLDELDALGGNRSAGGLHEASRRLLSVLLREMEGFDAETKRTVVIGATNRKADLDPALLSRFDLVLTFGLPDTPCRQLILRQYARQLSDPELAQLAERTPGMSGRDLRDVCEHTERRWASKIIRGEVQDEELPPLSEYLASAQERANAVQHVQRQAESAGGLDRLLAAAGERGSSLSSWLTGPGR